MSAGDPPVFSYGALMEVMDGLDAQVYGTGISSRSQETIRLYWSDSDILVPGAEEHSLRGTILMFEQRLLSLFRR